MILASKIPVTIIRGGTSKGVFIRGDHLPSNPQQRDQMLLSVMGSPDPSGRQLDGLGGGISSTSKVAIIQPSDKPEFDINYYFGQVSLNQAEIDWKGSCGNLAAAAALYAIKEELVQLEIDKSTCINIWQANLGYQIQATVYPLNAPDSWISIPGVPGKGLGIYLNFILPTSSVLPGNQPIYSLRLPNEQKIDATLISGANPTVFVRSKDIRLTGNELPESIDYKKLQVVINSLCSQAAEIMGITNNAALRVSWLSGPNDHTLSDGTKLSKHEHDICGRISTEGRVHHAFTGTGSINLACAAKIPGTIPHSIIKNNGKEPIKLAHPLGVMKIDANVVYDSILNAWSIKSSGMMRSARILMTGEAYLKNDLPYLGGEST